MVPTGLAVAFNCSASVEWMWGKLWYLLVFSNDLLLNGGSASRKPLKYGDREIKDQTDTRKANQDPQQTAKIYNSGSHCRASLHGLRFEGLQPHASWPGHGKSDTRVHDCQKTDRKQPLFPNNSSIDGCTNSFIGKCCQVVRLVPNLAKQPQNDLI